ncbi:hypothetical protein CC78DRAFT_545903 [Lojkania enalia]|uniref:Uncharacterized protein n=1 Tax=Lojkania enalia TaxID=147567 RepID=A0A9P4K6B9_9PLEO|nr:hypothetical protein CC78DRAFT_545903 [Didymosphaeria enalia]
MSSASCSGSSGHLPMYCTEPQSMGMAGSQLATAPPPPDGSAQFPQPARQIACFAFEMPVSESRGCLAHRGLQMGVVAEASWTQPLTLQQAPQDRSELRLRHGTLRDRIRLALAIRPLRRHGEEVQSVVIGSCRPESQPAILGGSCPARFRAQDRYPTSSVEVLPQLYATHEVTGIVQLCSFARLL